VASGSVKVWVVGCNYCSDISCGQRQCEGVGGWM